MNKLDVSTSLALSPSSTSDLEPASWLVVIIPSLEADLSAATQQVWELANVGSRRVRFIGLYENTAQELILRRQLAGISAMVSSAGIYTETEHIFGSDLAEAVRSRSQAGDMIVCLSDHRIGRLNRSVSNILQANIDLPIYILSSPFVVGNASFHWASRLIFWSVSIAMIIGFLPLQAGIDKVTSGWIQTTLILIFATLELCMLWVWNNLFS